MGRRSRKPILSEEEIHQAFDGPEGDRFPPFLDSDQVCELLRISKGTFKDWKAKGRFEGTYRKRGKRLFFVRSKLIDEIFNGKEWE